MVEWAGFLAGSLPPVLKNATEETLSDVMEKTRRRSRIGLILFLVAFAGLPINSPVGPFASTQDTLIAVGRRLSRSKSERELTALANHSILPSGAPWQQAISGSGSTPKCSFT
jgi:hypothetical protein